MGLGNSGDNANNCSNNQQRVAKRAKNSFFFFLEMEMYLVVDSNFVAKNSFKWVILICWWVNQQSDTEKRLAYM